LEPVILLDNWMKFIITAVQIVGGLIMILAIVISWLQYRLQRTEVIKQNNKIISLLEEILKK